MRKKILGVIFAVFMLTAMCAVLVGADDIDVTELNRIWKDSRWIYIDESGNEISVTTIEHDDIGKFSDGMAWIRKDDKFGYIDTSGELVIPMIYDAFISDTIDTQVVMIDFSEGLAAVIVDGKCGFINKTGELVIPAIYDGDFFRGEWISYIPMFDDGLARVRKDGKFGYINQTGDIAVPFEYAWAGDYHTGFFTEGLIRVSTVDYGDDRKFGFVDTNGNIVVPFEYGVVLNFSNGLAAVTHDNDSSSENWGFIDKTGEVVIPFGYAIGHQWMGFSYFNEYGFAIVWENMWDNENRKCGVIDRKGALIVPYEYSEIQFSSEGTISGKINGNQEFVFIYWSPAEEHTDSSDSTETVNNTVPIIQETTDNIVENGTNTTLYIIICTIILFAIVAISIILVITKKKK